MVRAARVAGPVGAVDEEDVLPAVVVVVDEGDARAHGFREPFLAEGAVVVGEVDSGGAVMSSKWIAEVALGGCFESRAVASVADRERR